MSGILKLTELIAGGRNGVLFVCEHNDSKSQMAEGFARFLCPADLRVFSAGTSPSPVRDLTVRTMKEVGIDVSSQKPKGLSDIPLQAIAVAITLCPTEECPALPEHIQVLDWPLEHPGTEHGGEREALLAYRRSRDQIREMVSALF